MLWSEIKKAIDARLKEEQIEDTTFSHIVIYDSAKSLDIYFGLDRLLCVQGKK
jgi:hypothetical protein